MLVQTTACGNSTSGTVGTVDNTETMPESGTEADTEKEGDEVTALSLMQQVNTAEENVIMKCLFTVFMTVTEMESVI